MDERSLDKMDLSEIRSCLDVTDEHIARAMEPARSLSAPTPRQKMLELVRHMASVATPGAGAARILIAIARVAPRDWMEGDVEVRLVADGEGTALTLLVDDGLSTERLAGPLRVNAPLAELARAVHGAPHTLVPLRIHGPAAPDRLTLRRSHFSALPRKASYSALALDLMPALARQAPVAQPTEPQGRREPPPEDSYPKPDKVLEMPAEHSRKK